MFKKEIDKYFTLSGNLCWDYVISLEDDNEAYRLELETGEHWIAVMKEVFNSVKVKITISGVDKFTNFGETSNQ